MPRQKSHLKYQKTNSPISDQTRKKTRLKFTFKTELNDKGKTNITSETLSTNYLLMKY